MQLSKFCAYNIWANNEIANTIKLGNSEWPELKLVSSFATIKATCLHIYAAEDIWCNRLMKVKAILWKGNDNHLSMNNIFENWLVCSNNLLQISYTLDTETASKLLSFTNLKNSLITCTMQDALLHAVNHSSFHRGQLITMLRQVGATKLPITDYIYYCNHIASEKGV